MIEGHESRTDRGKDVEAHDKNNEETPNQDAETSGKNLKQPHEETDDATLPIVHPEHRDEQILHPHLEGNGSNIITDRPHAPPPNQNNPF